MAGERNLLLILKNLKPVLNPEVVVFTSMPEADIPENVNYISRFHEKEGVTMILTKENAVRHKFKFDGEFAWITISIHTSLQAVGLTAAISGALADQSISCNVVSAYYHDHVFVDYHKKDLAIDCLRNLSGSGKNR